MDFNKHGNFIICLSSNYAVHLKLILCYMSIIFQKTKIKMINSERGELSCKLERVSWVYIEFEERAKLVKEMVCS